MNILKYKFFLKEKKDSEVVADESIYTDLIKELSEMIEKSLKSSDAKIVTDFIKAYLSDQDKNQIEGLINDSDVYEFYLKYRNQIDQILSKINFYEESPSELNSFSLYDYVIIGTKRAVKEIVSKLEKD